MGYLSDRADPEKQAQYEMIKNIFGNEKAFIEAVLSQCDDEHKLKISSGDFWIALPPNLSRIMEVSFLDHKNNPFIRQADLLYNAIDDNRVNIYALKKSENAEIRVIEHKPSKDFGHLVHIFIYGPHDRNASITYYQTPSSDIEKIFYTDAESNIRGMIGQSSENLAYSIPSNFIEKLVYHKPAQYNSIALANANVDLALLDGQNTLFGLIETVFSDYEMDRFQSEGRIAIEDFKKILAVVPELGITPQSDTTIALGNATKEINNLKDENTKLKENSDSEITRLKAQLEAANAKLESVERANQSSKDTIVSLQSIIESIKGMVAKIPFIGKKLLAQINDLLHKSLPAPAKENGHSQFVASLAGQAQQAHEQEMSTSQPQQQQLNLDGHEPSEK